MTVDRERPRTERSGAKRARLERFSPQRRRGGTRLHCERGTYYTHGESQGSTVNVAADAMPITFRNC